MTPLLRRVPTVELAAWLRTLRRAPGDCAARRLASAIEIELRVRAIVATTPGIGVSHGAAAAATLDDPSC